MLAAQAFEITTSLNNAVQYISKIFVTSDGTPTGTTGIFLDGSNGGKIGIGTNTPSQALEINGNVALTTGWRMWTSTNQVYMAKNGHVGIGTGNPQSLLHVAGTAQFGDNLLAYTNSLDGIIQSPVEADLKFNTNWANTRMIISASWYVGINQTTPSANLDVKWTVKILSSLKVWGWSNWSNWYVASGIIWYFPNWVLTGSFNNAATWDTIRYLSCNDLYTMWRILILWFTWSNVSMVGLFWNTYFVLPGYGSMTYHLKAWETFAVVSDCSDKLIIYRQNYGQDIVWWWNIPINNNIFINNNIGISMQ